MIDNIIINKCAIIENCLKRIREEYDGFEMALYKDYTKQDSIILNLQRACEATIDLGMRWVRVRKLGIPQTSRDVFIFLEKNGEITKHLSEELQAMVGFRNVAVHDYQKVNLDIVRSILEKKLGNFTEFVQVVRLQMGKEQREL